MGAGDLVAAATTDPGGVAAMREEEEEEEVEAGWIGTALAASFASRFVVS
jgi:hypothetical protein